MDDKAHEHFTVLERKELSVKQVHAALRMEGEEELKRSSAALFWSAVACGTVLGLSMVGKGLLRHHLPDAEWRILVSSLGYAAGFIALELGRKELYTGNTLTAALPFFESRDRGMLSNVGRVWLVVLIGNIAGAALFALSVAWTTAFSSSLLQAFIELGSETVRYSFGTAFIKAVFGGWLIALMVWLAPGAHHSKIWVIGLITWLLAASELTHVIAGSVEAFVAIFSGHVPFGAYVVKFFVPVLAGNTIGAVVFVAILNQLQITTDNPDQPTSENHLVVDPARR